MSCHFLVVCCIDRLNVLISVLFFTNFSAGSWHDTRERCVLILRITGGPRSDQQHWNKPSGGFQRCSRAFRTRTVPGSCSHTWSSTSYSTCTFASSLPGPYTNTIAQKLHQQEAPASAGQPTKYFILIKEDAFLGELPTALLHRRRRVSQPHVQVVSAYGQGELGDSSGGGHQACTDRKQETGVKVLSRSGLFGSGY